MFKIVDQLALLVSRYAAVVVGALLALLVAASATVLLVDQRAEQQSNPQLAQIRERLPGAAQHAYVLFEANDALTVPASVYRPLVTFVEQLDPRLVADTAAVVTPDSGEFAAEGLRRDDGAAAAVLVRLAGDLSQTQQRAVLQAIERVAAQAADQNPRVAAATVVQGTMSQTPSALPLGWEVGAAAAVVLLVLLVGLWPTLAHYSRRQHLVHAVCDASLVVASAAGVFVLSAAAVTAALPHDGYGWVMLAAVSTVLPVPAAALLVVRHRQARIEQDADAARRAVLTAGPVVLTAGLVVAAAAAAVATVAALAGAPAAWSAGYAAVAGAVATLVPVLLVPSARTLLGRWRWLAAAAEVLTPVPPSAQALVSPVTVASVRLPALPALLLLGLAVGGGLLVTPQLTAAEPAGSVGAAAVDPQVERVSQQLPGLPSAQVLVLVAGSGLLEEGGLALLADAHQMAEDSVVLREGGLPWSDGLVARFAGGSGELVSALPEDVAEQAGRLLQLGDGPPATVAAYTIAAGRTAEQAATAVAGAYAPLAEGGAQVTVASPQNRAPITTLVAVAAAAAATVAVLAVVGLAAHALFRRARLAALVVLVAGAVAAIGVAAASSLLAVPRTTLLWQAPLLLAVVAAVAVLPAFEWALARDDGHEPASASAVTASTFGLATLLGCWAVAAASWLAGWLLASATVLLLAAVAAVAGLAAMWVVPACCQLSDRG